MKRIMISVGLGLLTPFIAILGAAPFEVPGENPMMERVGAGIAALLYSTVCQFLLARRNTKVANSNWPSVVAMVFTIGAICFLMLVAEGFGSWTYFAGPVLIAGSFGSVAGMFLGRMKDNSVAA